MNYTSNQAGDIFALTGLPEEVTAVLFAYYSRSPGSLRENLASLIASGDIEAHAAPTRAFASERAKAFHEKWTVGYGHSSVAEHAIVHLGIENVSILAAKAIEDGRLASYTEKSTRYVVFNRDSFVDLPELPNRLRALYRQNGERLFTTYLDLMPRVTADIAARNPTASPAAIRGQACDLLRGLLPAGTKTNLGLTANARALETMLSKMLSSPLAEVRRVAEDMHREALTVAPTLVKYAAPNAYRAGVGAAVADATLGALAPIGGPLDFYGTNGAARLVWHDPAAVGKVALALAYDSENHPIDAKTMLWGLTTLDDFDPAQVICAALANRGPHDPVPRGFEASSITFEILTDYGAWRDLQRHRLISQTMQTLGCALDYETPPELIEMGFAEPYHVAMSKAADVWDTIAKTHPLEAQYAVPLGYRVRTLWTLNLRELFHVIELRSGKQGHASYRKIAHGLYEEACRAHPWLRGLIRVDLGDYAMAREVAK